MARYLNRKEEPVEVSDEHIETAIELKLELQKESPSGRCSWAKHRRMMREEGFHDSDTNEGYRQLIKQEQKKVDKLPSALKHADMLSDKKLESVRNAVGDMYIAKRAMQNKNRELQKSKREIADDFLFIEEVKSHISELDVSALNVSKLKPLEVSENAMLINASDWHIGLKTPTYNFEIANKRVEQYARECLHYAKMFNINKVYVQNLADSIEGAYMRNNQAYDIEFDFSMQVVKATEIIFKFFNMLSQDLEVVYLGGIFGNHSRISSKTDNISGDSSENIIDASLKSFISLANNPRISVDDKKQDNFSLSFSINGKNIKSVHGDLIPKKGDRITKFISSDKIDYDILLYGHYHHASLMEQNHNRLEIGTGCLQGTTDYSKQLGYDTVPSQTIIVFEGDKVLPIRVVLD